MASFSYKIQPANEAKIYKVTADTLLEAILTVLYAASSDLTYATVRCGNSGVINLYRCDYNQGIVSKRFVAEFFLHSVEKEFLTT